MKRLSTILFLFSLLFFNSACTTTGTSSQGQLADLAPGQAPWQRIISKWQHRVDSQQLCSIDHQLMAQFRAQLAAEGWHNGLVESILISSQKLTRPAMEITDHWDTPQEFMGRNMAGDCEDIAIFLLATLRSLGYPHQTRVLAAKTLFAEHALLKVEMPDGSWQVFETTQPIKPGARLVYTPIVEFDEREIIFASI